MAARSFGSDLAHHLGQRQSRRAWAPAAQDGIISPAGLLLGFSSAGASERTPLIAGSSAIVAGMPTAGEAKWTETAVEREGQIAATAEERQEPKAGREAERAEIVAVYVAKEPAPELAGEVVDALMRRSPLKAALEHEHGIVRLVSAAHVAIAGTGAALAFGLGAAIPSLLAWYPPARIELPLITVSLLVSLVAISVAGVRAGGVDACEANSGPDADRGRLHHPRQLHRGRRGVLGSGLIDQARRRRWLRCRWLRRRRVRSGRSGWGCGASLSGGRT